ncbi:MAG: PIN domain-containing protein [Oscillospiraceae bacterium]|nr:PIN domain-containing protein [Oscillospiraceae bacterium]
MKMLDTNMIVRYFLQDDEEMADKVKNVLKSEKVFILHEVIAEVIYVMVKTYKQDRIQTA